MITAFTLATTLTAVPVSVTQVRHDAMAAAAEHGLDRQHPAVDAWLVALSELASNCVRHAAATSPTFDVRLTIDQDSLALAVHDRHPRQPVALSEPHADDSGGWGLFLVQQLVTEAGGHTSVDPDTDGHGKTILVHLPCSNPTSPAR
ncbi:Histidine kinase-like ATPase domain-containing protein [Streptomyces sp. DvalAA-14]|uniref:ATP-binding protein n=1 Tax=unclassified Streptomyces TaxID=2593676 RepID=UPI00081B7EF6|nr:MULTISPECIES: ATP-binding protein [unclassified Streptomyces]MYS22234.1 ATP-binding protein [Streptomyces sp. SID4948]SCE11752.1 Histidine kinase-like ATPase domain-containing protein [Streptomyces sp. DvalAA-14]